MSLGLRPTYECINPLKTYNMAKNKKPRKSGNPSFSQMNKQQQMQHLEKLARENEKWKASNECLREVLKVTGGLDRINELYSSGYLLQTFANSFYEEANEVLQRYGMKGGSLGRLFSKAQRSNDEYFDAFYGLIKDSNEKSLKTVSEGCFDDLDRLRKAFFEAFPEKSEEWEPDTTKEERLREIEERFGVEIKRVQ